MFTDLLDSLGGLSTAGLCVAVAFFAFSETAIFLDLLVPGEVGLVLAGAAAAHGDQPVGLVIAASALGATTGDLLSYGLGRRWGRDLIDRFEVTRVRVSPLVDRAEQHFDHHGGRAIFLARWVGALRAVVPFVAGMGRLRFSIFVGWNVAASLCWASLVVTVGYVFGARVAAAVDRVGFAVSATVVTLLVIWALRQRSRRRP
jgi:membrane protein DedA with SNARE-associated domain